MGNLYLGYDLHVNVFCTFRNGVYLYGCAAYPTPNYDENGVATAARPCVLVALLGSVALSLLAGAEALLLTVTLPTFRKANNILEISYIPWIILYNL